MHSKEVRDKPRSLELDEEISIDSVELRAKGDKKKGSSKVPEACKNSIAKLKAIMKRCGVKKTNKPSKGNNRK